MIARVRRWGFNSMGAFSALPPTALQAASFPHVAHLPLGEWEGIPRLPGVFESRHEVIAVAKRAADKAKASTASALHVDEELGNAYPQSLLFDEGL